MDKEEREVYKNRQNIGFPKPTGSDSRRIRLQEYREQQRQNKELERMARLNLLEVDIDEVKREQVISGSLFDDIVTAADLYGVFEDLYGPDRYFRPCLDLQVRYIQKTRRYFCHSRSNFRHFRGTVHVI